MLNKCKSACWPVSSNSYLGKLNLNNKMINQSTSARFGVQSNTFGNSENNQREAMQYLICLCSAQVFHSRFGNFPT
jgi:hypothetical protein